MEPGTFLILGANGQLGSELRRLYPQARATDTEELDITNLSSIANYDWDNVKVILNAAAYTNVDGAETPEGRLAAWEVNASAVANLVGVAANHDILLVHVSTDYVFDGTKSTHDETEPLSPLSIYGASKAAGDLTIGFAPKHYLLRTSWVVGQGKNFVRTMLEIGSKGISPKVVSDQVGRLTFTSELAAAIDHLLKTRPGFGTYNITNGGQAVSWADITRSIFDIAGFNLEVIDTTTNEYYKDKPQSAKRPLNSVMDLSKIETTGFKPTDWKDSLENYIKKEVTK